MTSLSPQNRDYWGKRVFFGPEHPEHPEKPDFRSIHPEVLRLTPPPLLKVGDVAQWLRLKESTIRKWVSRGRIPYLKLGRAVCFQAEDIQEWLHQRTHRNSDGSLTIFKTSRTRL